MSSILDERSLTIENFEQAVAVGCTRNQILTMFDISGDDMDKWCRENYKGHDFRTVWEMVRQASYVEFLNIVKVLSERGNPSALGIISKALDANAADNVTRIIFDNNMAKETDEDKEN